MKENLIMKGIKLQKESQILFNQGKYDEARKVKIVANRILDGFNEKLVTEHFKLVSKKKKTR